MTIEAREVAGLVLRACPSFAKVWDEIEEENADEESPGGRLHYPDAAALLRHLAELHLNGTTHEFRAVFDLIERLVADGDQYVSELGVIGYLEGFQMQTIRQFGVDPEVAFRPRFGPLSNAWWDRLNRFWDGEHDALQVSDAQVQEEAQAYKPGPTKEQSA